MSENEKENGQPRRKWIRILVGVLVFAAFIEFWYLPRERVNEYRLLGGSPAVTSVSRDTLEYQRRRYELRSGMDDLRREERRLQRDREELERMRRAR